MPIFRHNVIRQAEKHEELPFSLHTAYLAFSIYIAFLQVFLYSFEQRSSGWSWPNWTGIMSAYEAEYVFGAPLNMKFQSEFYKFNDDERRLSTTIMQYWANFAATG